MISLARPGRTAFAVPLALVLVGCRVASNATPDAGPAQLGAKDTTAAKKPPALRVAKPVVPPLPDLPSLAQHVSVAAPPTASIPADSDHPCRAVWTGSVDASLACARSVLGTATTAGQQASGLLFGKDDGNGAVALVPRALLARNPDMLPSVVDHRHDGTEGPVRDQGTAPACTAFATAAAIDHVIARWSGKANPVSVMQVWSRYHSPYIDGSLASNVGQVLGPEQGWPFNAREATGWVPCTDFAKPPKTGCGLPVSDPHLQKLASSGVAEVTEIEYLPTPLDTATLQAKLAAGMDVMIGMELPSSFVPTGKPGAKYVAHYTRSAGPDAGHAMLLAGYAKLQHGTYFLLHNSWGPNWGDGGYAWMHEATLGLWAHEGVAVDAEPIVVDAANRPRRRRGEITCDAPFVPDSISGACAPPCADGSPRHDDVCPAPGQCPGGYVNLIGVCVLAAPTAKGNDPSTGIAWTCGTGGCTYDLPRASDPACTGGVCKASCPAPDYRVGRMGQELVCLE